MSQESGGNGGEKGKVIPLFRDLKAVSAYRPRSGEQHEDLRMTQEEFLSYFGVALKGLLAAFRPYLDSRQDWKVKGADNCTNLTNARAALEDLCRQNYADDPILEGQQPQSIDTLVNQIRKPLNTIKNSFTGSDRAITLEGSATVFSSLVEVLQAVRGSLTIKKGSDEYNLRIVRPINTGIGHITEVFKVENNRVVTTHNEPLLSVQIPHRGEQDEYRTARTSLLSTEQESWFKELKKRSDPMEPKAYFRKEELTPLIASLRNIEVLAKLPRYDSSFYEEGEQAIDLRNSIQGLYEDLEAPDGDIETKRRRERGKWSRALLRRIAGDVQQNMGVDHEALRKKINEAIILVERCTQKAKHSTIQSVARATEQ